MRKTLCLFLTVLLFLAAFGCADTQAEGDIVILYTGDVHCAIEENIGYAGLRAYVQAMREKTPYVTLVDCGDAVQGNYIGTISKGEYLVDIMNQVGYDLAVLGNHEFDYGMQQLSTLIDRANATYLGCNITYSGSGENALSAVKNYEILSYGDTRVAYIGVTTPATVTSSTPTYFMEDGAYVYDFADGADGQELYDCVQRNVDECLALGADYVILLTHLGDDEAVSAFSSVALLRNTTGVDACLDAHAHNQIPCRIEQNKDGEDVLLSSTGTQLAAIGQLVITSEGVLTTTLIGEYTRRDAQTLAFLDEIKSGYQEEMQKVVAHSDLALSCASADGVRLVRNRETAIGNFVADAYRAATGADIAMINGGGIHADLPQGEITYADILSLHPYGNMLCVAQVSGQQILDCLEMAYRKTQAQYAENGLAVGENGQFQHVSGLRLTVDTSISSGVVVDENGEFLRVDGQRRVRDVMVLRANGTYVPLDPAGTYTLAGHNYMIKNSGGGMNMFRDDPLLMDEGILDVQALIGYLADDLNGELGSHYAAPDGRITVR